MGNALEFVLKLTDMLTPGMRQAAAVTDSSAARIQRQMEQTQGSTRRMSASVNELRERLDAINKVRFSTTVKREFDESTRAAQRLERQIERLEGKGKGGFSLGGMIGSIGAAVGIGSIGSEALGQAANAESQQIAFKVLTGNKQSGDRLYGDIVRMADATPYESQDLGRSAKTMLGYGVDKSQIMPTLQMLGDVAAATDAPAQSLQSLSLAFGQVQAKGHLAGQEALQMINAGFNPLTIMADKIKDKFGGDVTKAMDFLDKKMEKGQITTSMVSAAFRIATGEGGKYHNMMKEQSETLGGRWSTFMDGVHHKLRDFGNLISPIAKGLMDFTTQLMNNGPALGLIAGGIGLVAVATGGWSAAQAVLNFVMNMNPIVRIISLILILAGFIYLLCSRYEGWGTSLRGLWEIIKGFVKLNGIAWKDFGENIWYWVQYAWLKMKGWVEWVGGAISNVANAFKLVTQFKFGQAAAALTAEIKTTAEAEITELQKRHEAGKLKNGQDALAAMNQMKEGWNMIGLKKKAGGGAPSIDPTTAATDDKHAFDKLKADGGLGKAKSVADSINQGGQRSITINVGKQIEKLEVHVMNAKEGAAEIESAVRESLRRVLLSMNGVATS